MAKFTELDTFTQSYVGTMIWSAPEDDDGAQLTVSRRTNRSVPNKLTPGDVMMTKQEYSQYQNAVDAFFERENIENLTGGHLRCTNCDEPWDDSDHCPDCGDHSQSHNEPFFSSRPCECCGTHLAGDREHATGYNRDTDEIHEYTVCLDCIYYAEYGQLDDMTMMEMEKNDNSAPPV